MNGNNNSFEEVPFQQKQQQSPIVIEVWEYIFGEQK